jgi:hypothetical protein
VDALPAPARSSPSADELRALGLLAQAQQPNSQLAALGVSYAQPAQGLPSERVVMLRRLFNEAQDRMKAGRSDPFVFQQLGIRG